MKLNLGSGQNAMAGFVNVDKVGDPDVKCDLEVFPWPWADDSIEEVLFHHSLEHMGSDADVFIGIMRELYRVCRTGAVVNIAVPHPRHDDFINDPTHVRAITPHLLACFSKAFCLQAKKEKASNSPLAIHYGVDFSIAGASYTLAEPYDTQLKQRVISEKEVTTLMSKYNNVAKEWRIQLRVIKEKPA